MKLHFIVVLMLLALGLGSCMTGLKVKSDYAKEVDFKSFKTYEFYGWRPEIVTILDEDQKGYVEDALKTQMAARSINKMGGGADLVVSVHILINSKTNITAYTNSYYGSSFDYSPGTIWINSYSPTTFETVDYKEGTMIIDVFDNKTKKVIWQGIGNRVIDKNPKSIKANLEKTVAAILVNFPPKK